MKRICNEKNQQWQKDYPSYAESYEIKLPDWIVYTPKRLDNVFSGRKLQQGTTLVEVKRKTVCELGGLSQTNKLKVSS